jgi:hypothetical protein
MSFAAICIYQNSHSLKQMNDNIGFNLTILFAVSSTGYSENYATV